VKHQYHRSKINLQNNHTVIIIERQQFDLLLTEVAPPRSEQST